MKLPFTFGDGGGLPLLLSAQAAIVAIEPRPTAPSMRLECITAELVGAFHLGPCSRARAMKSSSDSRGASIVYLLLVLGRRSILILPRSSRVARAARTFTHCSAGNPKSAVIIGRLGVQYHLLPA